MTLTLLHISDLHFGPHYLPDVGEAMLRAAHELPADAIVASGDFTQRAKPAQFAEARQFLDRLPPGPLVVVPGNHDVPLFRVVERVLDPYGNYRRHISEQLDSVQRLESAVIVALNTTAPLRAIIEGRIRSWQLDYCEDALRQAPAEAIKVVVAHHHFAHAPDYVRDTPIHGARRALARLAAMGVELILGGHLHRAYVANSLDVYPGPEDSIGITIAQSGTSTSGRGRGRERKQNSFNLVQVDATTIRVTRYMYFRRQGAFAPFCLHQFPRAAQLAPAEQPA